MLRPLYQKKFLLDTLQTTHGYYLVISAKNCNVQVHQPLMHPRVLKLNKMLADILGEMKNEALTKPM